MSECKTKLGKRLLAIRNKAIEGGMELLSEDEINALLNPQDAIARLTQELEEARRWVNDLQSGMYINCVYCGHRYGPKDKVPDSMAEVLKRHIEKCPKHPMSKIKAELDEARAENERLRKYEAVCHCGDPVSKHNMGSGHPPVEMPEQCPYAKDLAACRKELDEARGKVEAYEPIVAAVESHLQRAMLILKGGLEDE